MKSDSRCTAGSSNSSRRRRVRYGTTVSKTRLGIASDEIIEEVIVRERDAAQARSKDFLVRATSAVNCSVRCPRWRTTCDQSRGVSRAIYRQDLHIWSRIHGDWEALGGSLGDELDGFGSVCIKTSAITSGGRPTRGDGASGMVLNPSRHETEDNTIEKRRVNGNKIR